MSTAPDPPFAPVPAEAGGRDDGDGNGGPGSSAPTPDPNAESVPDQAPAGKPDGAPGTGPDADASDDADGAEPRRRFGFHKATVREIIERHFRVYEERDALPGLDQAVLVAFFVMADREAIDKKFPKLQEELAEVDPLIAATLREEGGETIIVVNRRTEEAQRGDPRMAMLLAVGTLLTLTLSGSIAWLAFEGSIQLSRMFTPRFLGLGFVTFALPFVFVFGMQELARRLVAKRHGMKLAAPYWIPVPPIVFVLSIGTFGSLVRPRGSYVDRRAMFDIAAAGPIVGFLAAVPIVILGILLTSSAGVIVPDGGSVGLEVIAPDGTSWADTDVGLVRPFERSTPDDAFRAHNITITGDIATAGRSYGQTGWTARIVGAGTSGAPVEFHWVATAVLDNGTLRAVNITDGEVLPGDEQAVVFDLPNQTATLRLHLEYAVPDRTTVELGMPLAYRALDAWFGDGEERLMHPLGMAGWGIMLTLGITLLPTGRFDGGAVARAALGEKMIVVSWGALIGVAVLWFFYPGWLYLVLTVLLFLGARHPGALNETTQLDARRWAVLGVLVVLFVILFVPIPAFLPDRGF